MSPVLKLTDITVTFPDGTDRVTAVDRASLELLPGELVAVTGPSGSGKSTLLAVAATLLNPDSGRRELAGRDITTMTSSQAGRIRRENIGIIFQQPNLFSSLSAREQLTMTRHLLAPWQRRQSRRDVERRADYLLEALDIAEVAHRKSPELSGGQQQRVNIARALMHNPQVLIVDEPTSALDSARAKQVMDVLLRVVREENVGTLLVTHDDRASSQADRHLRMVDGVLSSGQFIAGVAT